MALGFHGFPVVLKLVNIIVPKKCMKLYMVSQIRVRYFNCNKLLLLDALIDVEYLHPHLCITSLQNHWSV
jgi:hypothetical protein